MICEVDTWISFSTERWGWVQAWARHCGSSAIRQSYHLRLVDPWSDLSILHYLFVSRSLMQVKTVSTSNGTNSACQCLSCEPHWTPGLSLCSNWYRFWSTCCRRIYQGSVTSHPGGTLTHIYWILVRCSGRSTYHYTRPHSAPSLWTWSHRRWACLILCAQKWPPLRSSFERPGKDWSMVAQMNLQSMEAKRLLDDRVPWLVCILRLGVAPLPSLQVLEAISTHHLIITTIIIVEATSEAVWMTASDYSFGPRQLLNSC